MHSSKVFFNESLFVLLLPMSNLLFMQYIGAGLINKQIKLKIIDSLFSFNKCNGVITKSQIGKSFDNITCYKMSQK